MPGDSKSRSIQTTLQRKVDPEKDRPAKQKRTHSDVSEDGSTVESDFQHIQKELQEINECLRGNVSRGDLDKALTCVVKTDDLKSIVTSIVTEVLNNVKQELDTKLRERTEKLENKLDSLLIENEELRETIQRQDRTIQELSSTVRENGYRADLALKQANYNKQYSRRCNIKITNHQENENENLNDSFVNLVKSDLKIDVDPQDIIAIHRIPGKIDEPRPVICKLNNTEIKTNIMKKKKDLKNNVKFLDDITKRNMALLWKLRQHDKIDSAWFYNGNIYGKSGERRIKFDILDNIDSKVTDQSITQEF